MIIPDINILIYAVNSDSPFHEKAREWVGEVFSGREPVGLTWIVILGFIRIVTSGRIMPTPISSDDALAVVEEWLNLPVTQIVNPGDNHWGILKELLAALGSAGNMTSDAHIAAMAIEQRGIIYSTDNDFSRYRGIRWKNPLDG